MTKYFHTKVNDKMYYGKHLHLDCKSCMRNKVQDIVLWKHFLQELVIDIDMEAHGEPIVERFGGGIDVGISGVQFITTSLISVHTNDESGDAYLDVFSCKWFDEDIVKVKVDEFFEPLNMKLIILLRG